MSAWHVGGGGWSIDRSISRVTEPGDVTAVVCWSFEREPLPLGRSSLERMHFTPLGALLLNSHGTW